ncbi:MAG: leucyl aminopeptidase family protein [Alphaproteobacteria bacterium]|nr:MAG: leucyl aminopeptidase family protein [Alphaproteobacteria bacterium]
MTVSCFAKAGSHGVPIFMLEDGALAGWLKKAPETARAWVRGQGFTAAPASHLAVPDATGNVAAVLFGTPRDELAGPWPYAALAEALPAGRYAFASGLPDGQADMAALGWALGHYRFARYRSTAAGDMKKPRRLVLPAGCDDAAVARAYDAIALVRDLVNTPAADMGPAALAAAVRTVARAHGARVAVTTGKNLLTANLPAIHAVGRAAAAAPRLIDMRWGKAGAPRLTLVGKGVCFDTGGLDIKPASAMRLMKKDMGGAAHALALAQMVMAARLPVRLRLLIPAVENSVAGNALRPGDVIATRKGLSVEIGNTDAEGRVVLCDALALADEETPDLLLDFATLTGAARIALGPDLPALFTPDDALAAALEDAGRRLADPLWRLPLWRPYADMLKSPIADLCNISQDGFAGAITAALYLDRFVTRARAWAHIDLFAWNPQTRPGRPKGGEAMGLRAAFAVIAQRYRNTGNGA